MKLRINDKVIIPTGSKVRSSKAINTVYSTEYNVKGVVLSTNDKETVIAIDDTSTCLVVETINVHFSDQGPANAGKTWTDAEREWVEQVYSAQRDYLATALRRGSYAIDWEVYRLLKARLNQ